MSSKPRRRLTGVPQRRIRPRARPANALIDTPPARQPKAQTIGTLVTALTAIAALVFTGLSLNATLQGQYTDRYTKAIEQLGHQGPEGLQVRLGGVYALERLARDSPRDQPTIIEVLSAFIRGGRPLPTTTARVTPPRPVHHLNP